jgi:cation diffusion facilitator family transporter
MSPQDAYELPPDKRKVLNKAIRLEWLTIAFFVSAVVLLYLTLGSSQAMKAAWIEDLLAFVPPISFLVAARIRYRPANDDYPYGYHRAVGIGFLCASIALFVLGLWVLYDSAIRLIRFEHPPIGLVQPFGEPVWLGWLMLAALGYTILPAVLLGRAKIPLARGLHDKILWADAEMNKADWMTAGAAMLGIVGIYFGLWWADAVAAIFISLSIVKDGVKSIGAAVADLMDQAPRLVDDSARDPVPARVEAELRAMTWIDDARVRLRDEGHVFVGDAIVVPKNPTDDLTGKIDAARRSLLELDWRLHDLTIMPVLELTETQHVEERDIEERDART